MHWALVVFRRKKEILQRQIRHVLFDNFPRLTFSLIISLIFLLKYPFFFGTWLDVYIENKEENIDQKVARNVAFTLLFSPSLNIDCASFLKYLLYILQILKDTFLEEIFERTCFCNFLANCRKCIFRKVKSR